MPIKFIIVLKPSIHVIATVTDMGQCLTDCCKCYPIPGDGLVRMDY